MSGEFLPPGGIGKAWTVSTYFLSTPHTRFSNERSHMPTLEEMRERYRGKKKLGDNSPWKERFEPGDELRFQQQYLSQPMPELESGDSLVKPIPASQAVRKECEACRSNNYFGNLAHEHFCPFTKIKRESNCIFLEERIAKAEKAGYKDAALRVDVYCRVCERLVPLSMATQRTGVGGKWGCWLCPDHKHAFLSEPYTIPYQELMSHRPHLKDSEK